MDDNFPSPVEVQINEYVSHNLKIYHSKTTAYYPSMSVLLFLYTNVVLWLHDKPFSKRKMQTRISDFKWFWVKQRVLLKFRTSSLSVRTKTIPYQLDCLNFCCLRFWCVKICDQNCCLTTPPSQIPHRYTLLYEVLHWYMNYYFNIWSSTLIYEVLHWYMKFYIDIWSITLI